MKFHTILFDLDGTLLNTLEDLTDSTNYAMEQMGYPRHTLEEVRSFVNNGARKLILGACPPGTPEEKIDRCLGIFQAHYKTHLEVKTKPYPGILELLEQLQARGVKVGVVSNKFDGAVKPLCQRYFGQRIGVAVGEHEAEGVRRKPWPDTVFEALKALNAPAEGALYVGDSDVDILTARNAGLPCLSVSWGFRPRESLVAAGAKYIADRVEDFLPVMERMEDECKA